MLRIFICEDNKVQLERYQSIIENIILMENYDVELTLATHSPNELLLKVNELKGPGIYFLDVDLKADINGIQLAEKIREFDIEGFIIFVTTHSEMSYLTFMYKVEAMDYILKDNYNNIRDRISQCIKIATEKYLINSKTNKVYSINIEDRVVNVPYSDILLFETSPSIHKIILHTENMQFEFYGKMKNIEKDLINSGFCRCHTSYIINTCNIREIDKKNRFIIMKNGQKCLISTRGLKKLPVPS